VEVLIATCSAVRVYIGSDVGVQCGLSAGGRASEAGVDVSWCRRVAALMRPLATSTIATCSAVRVYIGCDVGVQCGLSAGGRASEAGVDVSWCRRVDAAPMFPIHTSRRRVHGLT